MRPAMVIALVSTAAVPVVVEGTMSTIDPAAFGEDSDLMTRAEEIARERFSANATITVLSVELQDHRLGSFGEKIKADPGYRFHAAQVRIENVGGIDFPVSTWHFSARDEIGSDHAVELGGAHEDFDASRLGRGQARVGTLLFELEKGSYLTAIVWQGELGEAEGPVPAYPIE